VTSVSSIEENAAEIPPEWLAEFEAARKRPLAQRFRCSFIRTYKPVMDDSDYRSTRWPITASDVEIIYRIG